MTGLGAVSEFSQCIFSGIALWQAASCFLVRLLFFTDLSLIKTGRLAQPIVQGISLFSIIEKKRKEKIGNKNDC